MAAVRGRVVVSCLVNRHKTKQLQTAAHE